MPIVIVQTNLSDREVPDDFIFKLSKLTSETLNKTEDRVQISLHTNMRMCRNGTTDPMIIIQIWSFGVFSPENNKGYGPKFLDFLSPTLGIPESRIAVVFHPIEPTDIAKRQ